MRPNESTSVPARASAWSALSSVRLFDLGVVPPPAARRRPNLRYCSAPWIRLKAPAAIERRTGWRCSGHLATLDVGQLIQDVRRSGARGRRPAAGAA